MTTYVYIVFFKQGPQYLYPNFGWAVVETQEPLASDADVLKVQNNIARTRMEGAIITSVTPTMVKEA